MKSYDEYMKTSNYDAMSAMIDREDIPAISTIIGSEACDALRWEDYNCVVEALVAGEFEIIKENENVN